MWGRFKGEIAFKSGFSCRETFHVSPAAKWICRFVMQIGDDSPGLRFAGPALSPASRKEGKKRENYSQPLYAAQPERGVERAQRCSG